jgi:hypothetical protein
MASDIPHPGVFVHNFLQVIDIILLIGQNKNTLQTTLGHEPLQQTPSF